ncbi:cellulose-growth-specific protein [Coprinellus micaceus]|uniref:AA9 family lytic polysaccharide monooxygenase n=1 Tax=Coprinellus micaceus TaxID=71717 RepID=A0A4Y7THL3_COPMI|nr:cellulose-growth-specific protein [Coprinellus micaceus]
MLLAPLLTLASFFVSQTIAHGGITSYVIDDKPYPGWQPLEPAEGQVSIARPYVNFSPILDTADVNLACNNNEGLPTEGQRSAHVRGGSVITAKWQQQSHPPGPVLVYMANCHGSCKKANASELRWFKIAETGLASGNLINGTWGAGIVKEKLAYDVTVPHNLARGEYLIRHEVITIHITKYPQFYPNCAQLVVHARGGMNPPKRFLTKFPGAYSLEDPGLAVDIYTGSSTTTYTTPGPAVWKGERF